MKDEGDITEGFARSLSLYWDWRTQRLFSAAAKAGGSRAASAASPSGTATAAAAAGDEQQHPHQHQHAPHARGRFQDDTQALLCEHWLEMADAKHRYGSNLRPYYDHWWQRRRNDEEGKAAAAGSSSSPADADAFASDAERDEAARLFFEWLDSTPGGLELDLGRAESAGPSADAAAGPSRAKLERERVRYLTEEERAAMEVGVDASTGRLVYRQSGALVHTRERKEGGGGGGGDDSPRKNNKGDDGEEQPNNNKPCKWIWVLDRRGPRLYVHAKRRGTFHHSSFLEGAPALSAGGLEAEDGVVLRLTADSGHYRPSLDNFMSTVSLLRDWGADLSGAVLSAKHLPAPPPPPLATATTETTTAAAAATATAPLPAAARLRSLGATSAFANSVMLESAVEAALAADRAARKGGGGL